MEALERTPRAARQFLITDGEACWVEDSLRRRVRETQANTAARHTMVPKPVRT